MNDVKDLLKLYDGVDCSDWTEKQIDDHCRAKDTKVIEMWQETKSFDVYSHPYYIYDNIFSYMYISKLTCDDVKEFLESKGYDLSKMTAFDFYNGNGLTTLNLMRSFKSVDFFNDVDRQVDIFNKLLEKNGFEKKESTSYNNQDVFFVLNCIEHYFRPKEFLEEILKQAEGCKFLVISHGFNKSYWCGHYEYYSIDGKLVQNRNVWDMLEREILKSFKTVFVGTDTKTKVFERIM